MKTIIVVPTYNEADNLLVLVKALYESAPSNIDILIVDSNSPDGTGRLADDLAAKSGGRLHVLHQAAKLGLGRAYVDGFTWALERSYKALIEMDADLSHNPADIPLFLAAVTAGADVVIGSRYMNGISVINWPLRRILLSLGANEYVRRITGIPVFDRETGRFTGYRGTARRPRVGERAETMGLLGSALSGDSLRQLAHEVRTPLNAIAGFAEMIERQMLGPAPRAYRERATAILEETQRLQDVLDDLNEAAQLDGGTAPHDPEEVDCAMLLARVTAALGPLAADKGVTIALAIAPHCRGVMIDPTAAERMTTRLVSAAIGLARPGERIAVELSPGDGQKSETLLAVERPALIDGQDEPALFDACDIDGEEDGQPPLLGLGFTLRMVRGVAESCGGTLVIAPDQFRVRLPAIAAQQAGAEAGQAASGAAPLA